MTITADFSGGEKTVTTEPLYQWDAGQKLALSGLPATSTDIQVHFANAAMAQAIVKATATENSLPTCDIPNEFLQFGSAAKARAWVFYRTSNTEGYTVRTVLIPVTPRKRPNDYVSPEDPDSKGIVERAIELLEGYEDDLASKLSAAAGAVGTENLADESITVEKVADDLAAVINAKEVKSNKKTTLTGNESSNDFYPTTKAVADALEVVQAEIDSVKTYIPITSIFSRVSDLKNGATSTDGVITIPSGQTGNQTYLGIRTFTMANVKGTTLDFSATYEVSDSILSNMTPVVLTNGTGVTTKSITFSNNVVNAVIDVSSDTTTEFVLVALKLVNTSTLSADATIALVDYAVTKPSTVEEGIHTIIEEEVGDLKAEIDSVKVDTPITHLFSGVNSLQNGATSTDGIVTIPSGQTGNQTYLGIRTFEMSSIKGLTLNFSVPFEVSDSILSNMTPVVLTNGTGVTTKSITFSNNVVNAVIDVSSDTTTEFVLVALKLVNTTALSNDATIAVGDYVVTKPSTVEEGIHTIIDENLSENSDLSALEEMKKTELTEYFSLVSSALDGATVSGNVLTVPSGQKGNLAYIGIRVLAHIDRVKGHTFDVSIPATISSNLAGAKTGIFVHANGTGATVNSSSWDGVTAKANITIADNATSEYVVIAVKIVNSSAFTETATITIGDYVVTEAVSLQNGIANLLGSGRFYGKKMSCFGDSYTQQNGWQPKTKEILGLASYSNVAIYGGVLVTGYAGIQNIDLDSNILTVFYGTNDYSNNKELGTIDDDAVNPTTFYGALKYVFDWVSTNIPECLVVPITHTQRWASAKDLEFIANNGYGTDGQPKNDLGYSLADYADAIVEVARRYGYKTLDLNHWGQVNKNNEGSFYGRDHLHPSATSYILLGNKIAKFIQQE